MKYRELTQQLLVVPVAKHWLPRCLGVGSIVGLPEKNDLIPPNPLGLHEPAILYIDEAGRGIIGFLRQGATAYMRDSRSNTSTTPCDPSAPLAPVDQLREIIAKSRMPARVWLEKKGSKRPKLLRRVVRELGGNGKKDDADQLVIRLTRMLFKEEVNMARTTAVEETETAEERPAKKSRKAASNGGEKEVSKKAAREPETERHTQAQSAGEALLAIKGVTGTVKKMAQRLADGEELSKKQLTELRDAINAAAAEAREADEGKTASAYSAANKIVRRLQRAA